MTDAPLTHWNGTGTKRACESSDGGQPAVKRERHLSPEMLQAVCSDQVPIQS